MSSQLLTHTNGLGSLESEEIMEYYQALEDPRGDLLVRYFMIEDEEVRAKALPEVQHWMNSLVITPAIVLNEAARYIDDTRKFSRSSSSLEQVGLTAMAQIMQDSWYRIGIRCSLCYPTNRRRSKD